MLNRLQDRLNKRLEEGTLRSLSVFHGIDFYSNDYLGLSTYTLQDFPSERFASTGSRLIGGNSENFMDLEQKCATIFRSEAALVFNSGYVANLGLCSALFQKEDIVLYDEEIHTSIKDGLRLSVGKHYRFKHNDLQDLERLLNKFKTQKIFVYVESLYSMSGTFSPLAKLVELKSVYPFELIVDEAHSGGVFGDDGAGYAVSLDLQHHLFARIMTFGKAFGAQGAVVLGSKILIDYLVNFARPFIYTTALSPYDVLRIKEILDLNLNNQRKQLAENLNYFRSHFKDESRLISDAQSPIQMLRFSSDQLLSIESSASVRGFGIKVIWSPTVKKGEEGIRISIHSTHTSEQINGLLNIICS